MPCVRLSPAFSTCKLFLKPFWAFFICELEPMTAHTPEEVVMIESMLPVGPGPALYIQ